MPDEPSGTAENQGGESEDRGESEDLSGPGSSDETTEFLEPPPKDQDER